MKHIFYLSFFLCLIVPASAGENFQLRLAPLSALVKWYTLETAFKLSPSFDLGLNYTRYAAEVSDHGGNMFFPTFRGESFGVNGNHYFSRESEGSSGYVSLKVNHEDFRSVGHSSSLIRHYKGVSLTTVGGVRFNLDSLTPGLGLLFGGGIKTYVFEQTKKDNGVPVGGSSRRQGWIPLAEMKFTYSF